MTRPSLSAIVTGRHHKGNFRRTTNTRNHTSRIETVYDDRLEPEGQGARVTLKATVSGSGLRALMTPLVAMILKREDGDHLERVKTAAESG